MKDDIQAGRKLATRFWLKMSNEQSHSMGSRVRVYDIDRDMNSGSCYKMNMQGIFSNRKTPTARSILNRLQKTLKPDFLMFAIPRQLLTGPLASHQVCPQPHLKGPTQCLYSQPIGLISLEHSSLLNIGSAPLSSPAEGCFRTPSYWFSFLPCQH